MKEECVDNSDEYLKNVANDLKQELSELDCTLNKKIKIEPVSENGIDDNPDDSNEFTDAELRSHNLSDFLDNSPRLKEHQENSSSERLQNPNQKEQHVADNNLPTLISMQDDPLPFIEVGTQNTPMKHHPLLASTPIRQSPRLHPGSLQSLTEAKRLLSGHDREKAVHMAQELTSLLANASSCAQRLTELVMESSLSDSRYQEPPVLEPEAPIITPAISRRSSVEGNGILISESDNIFSNILGVSKGEMHQYQSQAKTVDDTSLSKSFSKPLNLLSKVKEENNIFSKSDGFCQIHRKSMDDRPPLLKKNNFSCTVDTNNSSEDLGKSENTLQSPNHFHVGEDIYLKHTPKIKAECKDFSGKSHRRQPKLIFRMKPDPELKKQIREERAQCPNAKAKLQFKWDDDSDVEIGLSPTLCNSNHGDFVRSPPHSHNFTSLKNKELPLLNEGRRYADTVTSLNIRQHPKTTSHSSVQGKVRKVRKVRLKMIETSRHFDLVSPSASPPTG